MRLASGRALVALTLLTTFARHARAQDTVVVARHVLAIDTMRVQPFRRAYDMIVRTRDSSIVIGQREITLSSATYSGAPAWLLVETRGGQIAAAESLFLTPGLRSLHWSSALGVARLGAEFVGDSIYGAVTTPAGKQNIVASGRSGLLVSAPMVEAILPLLPLTSTWSDSVNVLSVDLGASQIIAAELAVVGEEDLQMDAPTLRPAWVVTLRTGDRRVLYWVDKADGAVLREQQALPSHVGMELEYRLRADSGSAPPP